MAVPGVMRCNLVLSYFAQGSRSSENFHMYKLALLASLLHPIARVSFHYIINLPLHVYTAIEH